MEPSTSDPVWECRLLLSEFPVIAAFHVTALRRRPQAPDQNGKSGTVSFGFLSPSLGQLIRGWGGGKDGEEENRLEHGGVSGEDTVSLGCPWYSPMAAHYLPFLEALR